MCFLFLESIQNAILNQRQIADTQRQIVFLLGTVSRQPGVKQTQNAHCGATGDPPFFL
jgi:hypothetical protein